MFISLRSLKIIWLNYIILPDFLYLDETLLRLKYFWNRNLRCFIKDRLSGILSFMLSLRSFIIFISSIKLRRFTIWTLDSSVLTAPALYAALQKTSLTHHAWRDLNLKVLTNERDLYQACLFTQWSAKMLVPEIIEGEIWHNFKYLRWNLQTHKKQIFRTKCILEHYYSHSRVRINVIWIQFICKKFAYLPIF